MIHLIYPFSKFLKHHNTTLHHNTPSQHLILLFATMTKPKATRVSPPKTTVHNAGKKHSPTTTGNRPIATNKSDSSTTNKSESLTTDKSESSTTTTTTQSDSSSENEEKYCFIVSKGPVEKDCPIDDVDKPVGVASCAFTALGMLLGLAMVQKRKDDELPDDNDDVISGDVTTQEEYDEFIRTVQDKLVNFFNNSDKKSDKKDDTDKISFQLSLQLYTVQKIRLV